MLLRYKLATTILHRFIISNVYAGEMLKKRVASLSLFCDCQRMSKRKTKTIRIVSTLHARIKASLQRRGMKLEAWTERILADAIKQDK